MNACVTMLCDTANNETEALVKTKNEESVTPKSGDSENDEKTLQIIVAQEKSDKQQINDEKQQRNGEKQQMTGFKREASSSSLDSETKAKKIRNKPKPLVIENMKEYVESNTLEKLTTATLRHWLRQQSIHCTTRDKKADLVEKVCKHFLAS